MILLRRIQKLCQSLPPYIPRNKTFLKWWIFKFWCVRKKYTTVAYSQIDREYYSEHSGGVKIFLNPKSVTPSHQYCKKNKSFLDFPRFSIDSRRAPIDSKHSSICFKALRKALIWPGSWKTTGPCPPSFSGELCSSVIISYKDSNAVVIDKWPIPETIYKALIGIL